MPEYVVGCGFAMLNTTAVPGNIGVQVLSPDAPGKTAVCAAVPTLKNAMLVPSFTTRSTLPVFGSAVDVLAVEVTDTAIAIASAVNGT